MILQDQARLRRMISGFREAFGAEPVRFFSAPGRTELCGNHTDHQRGAVLAAAVNLDAVAAVRETGRDEIRVLSEGYSLCTVPLDQLDPDPSEYGSARSLIRGMAAGFAARGCPLRGFDAYVSSQVAPGSGLSSSAAFEVLIGTVLNGMLFEGRASAPEIARMAQDAENRFFGKPCGLMDQMASAVGNLVAIDFRNPEAPEISPIPFDFSKTEHALCIIDSRASHAGLTDEYAAIPAECGAVAACFGAAVLSEVSEAEFYDRIPLLRRRCGDRAVLRAIHFFQESRRAAQAADALRQNDFPGFLALLRESGRSSWMYLQNISPTGAVREQDMAITLALCEHSLGGTGAYRIHGGGFAGTAQAIVPLERLDGFRSDIDRVLGEGACRVLSIRPQGGVELEV